MPTPKSPEEIVKEFEDTKFAKGGGSSFECSDYEGMYADLKEFIRESLAAYALYIEGKMQKEEVDIPNDSLYIGYCRAIDDCKYILRREAEEVMKGV